MATTLIEPPRPAERQPVTSKQFRKLPEGPPYYELINGVLTMSPSPKIPHQRASKKLTVLLDRYVEQNNLGELFCAPMDVEFDSENTFQPDIFFVSNERKSILQEETGNIVGSPDLIVEILSKNKFNDLVTKRYFYEIYGVSEYWVVDLQKKTIEVFENQDMEFVRHGYAKRSGRVESKLLPGFGVSVEDLF